MPKSLEIVHPVSPEIAEEIRSEQDNPFSSKTALRLNNRIAKATVKSGGEEVRFDFRGRTTPLSVLVTQLDVSHMEAFLDSEDWSLKIDFIESSGIEGKYITEKENTITVTLKPKVLKNKHVRA